MVAACFCNRVFGVKNGTNKFSFCGMIKEMKEKGNSVSESQGSAIETETSKKRHLRGCTGC